MNEVLECQKCGKTFGRKAKRGRKPNLGPCCAPKPGASEAPKDAVTETLTCQHGHEWTRPLTRGRKPPFCPEHRLGTPVKSAPADPGEQVVKRPKGLPSFVTRPPAVQAILGGPLTELRRKLEFTVHEIEHPAAWREHADWDSLIKVHKLYCREAERIAVTKATPTVVEDET